MKTKADMFWKSFITVKDRLMDIDSLSDEKSEQILEELDDYLKKFSSGVDFIIGDLTEQGRTITFTANGDKDFFEDVIALAESMPPIDFWTIQSFLPAEGKNQKIDYENLHLESKDYYFLGLESDDIPDKIGIKVAKQNLNKTDDLLAGLYLLCEKMIGEYNATMMIDYFDIETLPKDFDKEGYLSLNYLPDFIEWKIEKNNE